MRYLVLDPPQPDYDSMTFDYDTDAGAGRALEQAGRRQADPDLSKFRKRGGKLIMTYGWADHDPAADDGRELLRGGRREERPDTHRLRRGCS